MIRPPYRYGKDIVQAVFRRPQFKALVSIHSQAEGRGGNLSADEISVIQGALDLSSKPASTCMTPLDKVTLLLHPTKQRGQGQVLLCSEMIAKGASA